MRAADLRPGLLVRYDPPWDGEGPPSPNPLAGTPHLMRVLNDRVTDGRANCEEVGTNFYRAPPVSWIVPVHPLEALAETPT